MPEILTNIRGVDALETSTKLVEEKEEGEVVDRHLVTTIKLRYTGSPSQIEKVLWALKAGQPITACFYSSQLTFATIDELVAAGKED